jgi:probable rRNA maturation factor
MSVYVSNESGSAVDEVELSALCRHVLDQMGIHPLAELSVLLVDVPSMERLHVQYMGLDGPTDVLAFPQDDLSAAGSRDNDKADTPETLLGDVVLCPEVAERQAAEAGHPPEHELHLLCTHGILHLLGYDHGEAAEQREMFAVQARLLASWRAVRAG